MCALHFESEERGKRNEYDDHLTVVFDYVAGTASGTTIKLPGKGKIPLRVGDGWREERSEVMGQ